MSDPVGEWKRRQNPLRQWATWLLAAGFLGPWLLPELEFPFGARLNFWPLYWAFLAGILAGVVSRGARQ